MGQPGWSQRQPPTREEPKNEVSDLAFTSATDQAQLVKDKEVSPVELVQTYLDRIDEFDGALNTYVTVDAERALVAAQVAADEVTSGADLPPFHGVPISIKDLFETAGLKTTMSCRALAEYVPDEDELAVKRIKDAGFIPLGKTNTPEFGSVPVTESELNGTCHNPWSTGHTPGGSSGGAAAGLASGLAPVAHASDGAGSIRIPSSCCGLFGIKPSRGRIPFGPQLSEHWHGFSTQGPIARSVMDAAGLLDVMQGYATGDPYWAPPPARPYSEEVGEDPGRLRIAFTTTNPNEIDPHPDVVAALQDAAQLLESLGHHVEEKGPGWVDATLAPSFIQLISTGTAVIDFLPHDELEPLNRFLVETAATITSVQHIQALTTAHQYARRVVQFWNDYDLLLTPTLGAPPLEVGAIFIDDDPFSQLFRSGLFIPYTPAANVTGQPAVSLPLYWNDAGLPIGVQLIGAPSREDVLFRISAQVETARPWADKRPTLSS